MDQSIKNDTVDEDLAGEESKNCNHHYLHHIDYDVYADQFDDGSAAMAKGQTDQRGAGNKIDSGING